MNKTIVLIVFILSYYSLKVCGQETEVYEIENLGSNVNSTYEEISPYITPDGKKLFFIVCGHPENTLYNKKSDAQSIWFCTLNEDGTWSKAKKLGYPFNTKLYNMLIAQTSDGTTRFITGYFEDFEEDPSYSRTGFSKCVLKKDGWGNPERMYVPDYEKMQKSKTITNNLSASNNILLMSFSENENDDTHDIYVSFLKNGKWTRPKKLPEPISGEYNDISPFLAADNVTLYFSSDRPGGYGSNDIYMSKRLDDSWEKWSEPVNLGEPINGPGWDAYFTIPASGNYFYMCKNADIVRIKPKQKQKPLPVTLVKGKVLNAKTNKPIGNVKINYVNLSTGEEIGIATSNVENGEYTILLPFGKHYSFQAFSEDFYSITENLNLTDSSLFEYKEVVKDLYLNPIEKGQTIRINNIFFETDKAELKSESFFELDKLAELLITHPRMEIFIAGHTDDVGSDEYNLTLSKKRAEAVVNYLISKKIDPRRLSYDGFGETKPIADNKTLEGKALNRRVEFTILKK